MPPPPKYRKRRPSNNPNKNELKASRNEAERHSRDAAGTFRERFPDLRSLHVAMRMESTAGVTLEESERSIPLDSAVMLDVPCPGGCSGGVFKLTEAIEMALNTGQDARDGMGLCQASSYRDPSLPCAVKFYYRVTIER